MLCPENASAVVSASAKLRRAGGKRVSAAGLGPAARCCWPRRGTARQAQGAGRALHPGHHDRLRTPVASYTKEIVKALLDRKQKEEAWQVLYLGAGHDA